MTNQADPTQEDIHIIIITLGLAFEDPHQRRKALAPIEEKLFTMACSLRPDLRESLQVVRKAYFDECLSIQSPYYQLMHTIALNAAARKMSEGLVGVEDCGFVKKIERSFAQCFWRLPPSYQLPVREDEANELVLFE